MDSAPTLSAPTLSPPETIAATLRVILHALLAALGTWRLEAGVAVALYRRTAQVGGRIARMLRRFQAGKLWRVPQRAARQQRAPRRKPAMVLPRRFGWLVQAGGHQAAAVGSQLHAVLQAPEMAALLAASPAAVRLLRPLCRALAVALPAMADTPRRRRTRTSRPRVAPELFRIPLSRGVLTAARRQGFGKIS